MSEELQITFAVISAIGVIAGIIFTYYRFFRKKVRIKTTLELQDRKKGGKEILQIVFRNDEHRPYQISNVGIFSKLGNPYTRYRKIRYKKEPKGFPITIEESESLVVSFYTSELIRIFNLINAGLIDTGSDPDYPYRGFYESYGKVKKFKLPIDLKYRIWPFKQDQNEVS